MLRIEYVALADLKRHPRNPKDHDLGAISRSVNRFGFTAPVIIDERTGYLAAGHGRIEHPRSLHHRYGVGGQSIPWLRAHVDPNAERVETARKHKYLYPLDDDMRRQIEPLRKPYPKREHADEATT